MHSPHPWFARIACAIMLPLLTACAAQPGASNIIDRHVASDYSGVVALRSDLHTPLVTRATGLAAREQARPNLANTRFMIGSATKWISAVTVLRLVDLGTLDLDAPIARHLPELPQANGAVTLRQLMSNRSGISNGLADAARNDPSIGKLEIGPVPGALRFGTGALDATPGEKWDYSVTNWILVAAVVERATGKPFTATVQELVLAPSKVHDTGFAVGAYENAPAVAVAYAASGARKISPPLPMVAASGILYSTAHDLVAIADTIYFSKLLSDRSRTALSTIHVVSEDYALGGRVKTIATSKGKRTLAWEAGTIGGYKALLAYDPADGRAVVLLNNTDMLQSDQAAMALGLFEAM